MIMPADECHRTLLMQDLTDDKSTLVQVTTWCRQAPSHYLSQCWLNSLSPYGVARPQWIDKLRPAQKGRCLRDIIFKCIFLSPVSKYTSYLAPLLLTWFNFNPSMDKPLHQLYSVEWNYLSIHKLRQCTVEVWERKSNFIPHFTGYVITYPCWDSW